MLFLLCILAVLLLLSVFLNWMDAKGTDSEGMPLPAKRGTENATLCFGLILDAGVNLTDYGEQVRAAS